MKLPYPLRSPVTTGIPGQGAAAAAIDAKGGAAPKPGIVVPFLRASHKHLEPAFDSGVVALTTSQIALGPYDVPSYGFMRDIVLLIEGSNGVIGTGTLVADFPFIVVDGIQLTDTNGNPLITPLTGYQLYLINSYGGYRGYNDVTTQPGFISTINFAMMLRIPVEITPWDAYGSLANQSGQAPFRIRLSLNTLANVFGTGTSLSARVRGYLDAYSPPDQRDLAGNIQEQAPPGHGAVQYWSVQSPVVAAGRLQPLITRTGNLIRNIILVHRDTGGLRSATVEPDEYSFNWDSRPLYTNLPNYVHRAMLREATGFNPPTGVLAFLNTDDQDGVAGFENRHLWYPTVGSSRLQFDATYGAAGTLEMLVNDIGVTPAGW